MSGLFVFFSNDCSMFKKYLSLFRNDQLYTALAYLVCIFLRYAVIGDDGVDTFQRTDDCKSISVKLAAVCDENGLICSVNYSGAKLGVIAVVVCKSVFEGDSGGADESLVNAEIFE